MDSSWRALQTYGFFFFFFQIRFQIIGQKTKNIQTNSECEYWSKFNVL